MVRLIEIREAVQKISEAISSVLNMDVIISDNEFNKIGDTKKHFDLEVEYIKDTYIIGKVLDNGIPVVTTGKEDNPTCVACKEKDKCNLMAMICIPIKYENQVLGAIGLIAISEAYREILIRTQENLIEFLNRMADLIVSKALEKEASDKLQVAMTQMVSIIDSVDEGIVALDETGRIIFSNSVIEEAFSLTTEALARRKMQDVFPMPEITRLVEKKVQFENMEANMTKGKRELHALVSGKVVQLGHKNAGAIITFKKMSDVFDVINKMSLTSRSTTFDDIVGTSVEIMKAKERSKKVADSNSTVLILGESGTGKELFARAIHYCSNRSEKPFIAFNCAAIPESLLESELFGYEDGAFTGASKGGKPGKFQLAQGGTIFLDEIGDVPIHLQTKLLRVLQEKSIEKIGGHKSISLDVRVIAATNKNLEDQVACGEFREDLYYRLSVIPIHVPPLRERIGDVEILLDHFLKLYNKKLSKSIRGFSSNAKALLLKNQWKGNVRELENVVEYAVNMEVSQYVTVDSLPQKIRQGAQDGVKEEAIGTLDEMERAMIIKALAVYGDTVKDKCMVAEQLGIGTATLYRKIKKYGIE